MKTNRFAECVLCGGFMLIIAFAAVSIAWNPVYAQQKVGAPPFKLTDPQRYRLEAAQQEFFRWQDKVNAAAEKFGEACQAAKEENKWPDVVCNLQDLSVVLREQPAASQAVIGNPTHETAAPTPPAAKEKK